MARKKPEGGGGAPDWLVTFADLMSLLVCFFVLIISFSVQDQQKLQVVAGSLRDAFGIKKIKQNAKGIIEIDGVPVRSFLKDLAPTDQALDTDFADTASNVRARQGPEASTHDFEKAENERPRRFTTAAASLRQAWQELPDFAELSQHIVVEETEEGLVVQLVDQDNRSMFPDGSSVPYAEARRIIVAMAKVLTRLPNRISITGHTARGSRDGLAGAAPWRLSAVRADAAREIFADHGIPHDRFAAVSGKADTDPLFPDNASVAANRRIEILLMEASPPLPPDLTPWN